MKEKIRKAFGGNTFKFGTYSVVVTAVVIAIVLVINLLVAQLPAAITNLDLSTLKLYSIGETTEKYVSALKEDVTIYVLQNDKAEDQTLDQLISKYADLSSHLKVEHIDPDYQPLLMQKYNITSDNLTSDAVDLLVVSDKRGKLISNSTIYQSGYVYGDSAYYYYMYTGDQSYLATYSYFYGEKEITSAISYVTTDVLPKLYVLSGHNEIALPSSMQTLLVDNNYSIGELNLITAGEVPSDADALIILDPSSDFTAEEVEKLEDYILTGGKCVIVNYSTKQASMPNYKEFLRYYGVYIPDTGYVFETAGYNYNQTSWELFEPLSSSHSIAASVDGSNAIRASYCQPIYQYDDKRSTLTIESFLSTSSGSWFRTDLTSKQYAEKIDSDVDGPFDLGVVITDETENGTGKLILFSTYDMITEQYIGGNNPYSNGALFTSAINNLCSLTSVINIAGKTTQLTTNQTTSSEFYSSLMLFVIIVPVITLIVGFVVWFRRRRR